MYEAQEKLHSFLKNLPNKTLAFFLRCYIFPRGRSYSPPPDDLTKKVSHIITSTGEARERLSEYAYTTIEPGNPLGLLQEALLLSEQTALIEAKIHQAKKDGLIKSDYLGYQIEEAETQKLLSSKEINQLRILHQKVSELLSVDDFHPNEIGRKT